MEKTKKPTNAQLQRRLEKSPLHLDRTKNTVSVFFSDKGLRLTADDLEGYALIATGSHTHCFQMVTPSGYSRPWMYTKRIIEIALENDCKTEDGYSYAKLLETLKAKEDKAEFNVATYYQWWASVIFDGLYSLSEDEFGSWLVYFKYLQIIATNSIILEERNADVTNKQFVEKFVGLMKEFTDGVDERVLLPKLTDEEFAKQQMEAMAQDEQEQAMGGQA